jgi:predicted phage terminase large subunit-like protein
VIDDPHKVKEAESELERQSVKDWWTLTMSLRGVALKVRRVVIMQRLHELDLAGCILEQGGYEHICLPMRYEVPSRNDKGLVVPRMLPTKIGGCDPRTSEGELLTPQQFGEQAVTSAEQSLGPYGIAGQLQQRPAPREGGMFKAAWFEPIDVAPPCETYIRGWDMAGTEGDGDFSAGCLIGRLDGVYYILDAVRGQWSSGMRNDRIVTLASEDAARGFDVKVWFERQPGADGEFVANQLKVRLIKEGYRADWYLPSVSKEDRADGLAAAAWAGKVRMVRGSWNRKFLDELMSFPNAAHDDQVDAASTAYNKLAMRRGVLVA